MLACELDEELRRTYMANFGTACLGDIREVSPRSVPSHDMLCAGFPCQPFSKAGAQTGFDDLARGTVVFNAMEIVRACRPASVLLENVPNFSRHQGGESLRVIVSELQRLGYQVFTRELSPHQFGIPQHRLRLYVVAIRGNIGKFEWPRPVEANSLDIRSVLDSCPADAVSISPRVEEYISCWQEFLDRLPPSEDVPSFPVWSMEYDADYPVDCGSLWRHDLTKLRKYRGSFGKPLLESTRASMIAGLPAYAQDRTLPFPMWKQQFINQNRDFFRRNRGYLRTWIDRVRLFPPSLQKFEWNCKGERKDLRRCVLQIRASGLRAKRAVSAPSLVAMTTTQVPIIPWERRYMTLRECARLQSLDSLAVIPPGARGYKALGNAVCASVVEAVMERVLSATNLESMNILQNEEAAVPVLQ